MKNIDKVTPFKTKVRTTDFGTVTTLQATTEVSAKGNISFGGKTLMANYVYKEDRAYDLIYTVVDADGNAESFAEDDGILPTLFLSPAGENYVSIVPYNPDKELEISIPVFDREDTELTKGNRPFTGEFIGTTDHFSIFYDVDSWSDTKPDKMLAMEFKDGQIKKKHNIKIPLPRNNDIFIENKEIHLLTKKGSSWLHRQIDEKGIEIRQRKLEAKQKVFWEILQLSFNAYSYLLTQEKGKIFIVKVDGEGKSDKTEIIDLKDPFFNTWQPVKISENTYVTRFNTEFGNGWFTTAEDRLLEIFYSKGQKGYRDLLTNEVLEMESENLAISGINKTADNGYAVVFYPMGDRESKNRELFVLNRVMQ